MKNSKPPKINMSQISEDIALHTGVSAESVKDVVYGFLHYITYLHLATDARINIRNYGNVKKKFLRGRVVGVRGGGTVEVPDRLKVLLSPEFMEVTRWKNMQSILATFSPALVAGPRRSSMDTSVCARIADLVLSNPQIDTLTGETKVEFLRKWVASTGANPTLNPSARRADLDGREHHVLNVRLAGLPCQVGVFDYVPMAAFLTAEFGHPSRSIVFLPGGWASVPDVSRTAFSSPDISAHIRPYGHTSEAQITSLISAYRMLKYGS